MVKKETRQNLWKLQRLRLYPSVVLVRKAESSWCHFFMLTTLQEREQEKGENDREAQSSSDSYDTDSSAAADSAKPPLPSEELPPPLPDEAPPALESEDDGWAPIWDETAQAFYFYNRFTSITQWDNPRVPEPAQSRPPGVANHDRIAPTASPPKRPHGGYDPSIHGDYDPTASYAVEGQTEETEVTEALDAGAPGSEYAASATFNRFTGKWQAATLTPENYNDENKSKRQMNAFFDVDKAANSHNGKSLKAERSAKKLSKQELKAFREKRKEKKEEKRRAWLRD